MRKLLTLLALWLCIANLKAQTTVAIADTGFAHWLLITIPAAIMGNQLDTTHIAVTSMKQMDTQDFEIMYLDDEMKDARRPIFAWAWLLILKNILKHRKSVLENTKALFVLELTIKQEINFSYN